MDLEKKLNNLNESLKKAQDLRYRADARKESLLKQKEELIEEIRGEGVEPEKIQEEIESLEKEIKRLTDEVEKLIPWDILAEGDNGGKA
ncbi:MAG: hypothetical protein PWQ96_2162 [Clostridia bacterium]|nr:hypothetical protein [Clostridiales bacterium]MDK2986518.1 hypothetical protein [Clostridia bacterium]